MSRRTAKGIVSLVVLALAAAFALLRPPASEQPTEKLDAPPVPKNESFRGDVVGVHDGDTITILWEDKEVKVRLFGIDAPETHPAQDYGQRAKQFASQLLYKKRARILVKDKRLTYGRVVGEVFVEAEGREVSANATIVASGFAWAYRQYSSDFVEQETEARNARRGLWADPKPMPPWEFRHGRSAD